MSIKTILQDHGVLAHVALSTELDILLSSLTPAPDPPMAHPSPGIWTGDVIIDLNQNKNPLPGFDFHLGLPTDSLGKVPFKLKLDSDGTDATKFWFWLILTKEERIYAGFKFVEKLPGLGLTAAKISGDATDGWELVPIPGMELMLTCPVGEAGSQPAPSLLVYGDPDKPVSMRFTPDTDPTEGIITLGFNSEAVLFGSSKVGFVCPKFILDDSDVNAGIGQGVQGLDPPLAHIDADDPSWRGFLARNLDFYLPKSVPFFGGQPIKGYFAVPTGAGGIQLLIETKVSKQDPVGGASRRPEFKIRIECMDPTATGLTGLVPTMIRASIQLPLKKDAPTAAGGFQFMGGEPVIGTATFSRDPVNDPGTMKVAVGISSQGPLGIVSVTSTKVVDINKIFNIAAGMATALVATGAIPKDASGKSILALVAAAGGVLSNLFEPDSQFVLHGAEIESAGHGLPAGEEVALSLDYSVSMLVKSLQVPGGSLSISMLDDQPMRIRIRRVTMTINMKKSGLDMFDLDFDKATMEVENPGAWQLEGLQQIFDVIGSRSGRGSAWIEVDLRFKLNLGPIKVSGLTIRSTLDEGGHPIVSITGIAAGIELDGLIDGDGAVHLIKGGFEASLGVSIVPIQFTADATVVYARPDPNGPPYIFLELSAELPAAIPLASTGLGLFALEGMFGVSLLPDYGVDDDNPVMRQLRWHHKQLADFTQSPGNLLFGLGAVVGTLPDYGFTFSSKAEIVVTAPDVSVRGALNGTVMRPRLPITAPSDVVVPGISFIGFIGVTAEAIDFAVVGSMDFRPLLQIRVPFAGHYPIQGDTSDWYTYLGADGYKGQGREIGPISAKVLPDILGIEADAYLMTRGKGIAGWPVVAPFVDLPDGFVIAFGFAVHSQFGLRPIAWAELFLGLDLLLIPDPLMFAGLGRASGGLHLGPFSLGVSAEVKFMATQADVYLWVQVTGRIELLFFDVEGTVTIAFGGTEPKPFLPPPEIHPLDVYEIAPDGSRHKTGVTAAFTDDTYRKLNTLTEDPNAAEAEANRVWPDILISIPFAFPIDVTVDPTQCKFDGIKGHGEPHVSKPLGTDLLKYRWQLASFTLFDVTNTANKFTGGTVVNKPMVARWQVPRGSADATELMLFTLTGDLWVNRRADQGKDVGDPISTESNICQFAPAPKPAWAIGRLGRHLDAAYLLPQSPLSFDPLVSQVRVVVHHFGIPEAGNEVALDSAFSVPTAYSLQPGGIWSFDKQLDLGLDRTFGGAFQSPWLDKPAELAIDRGYADPFTDGEMWEFFWQRLHLELIDSVTEGRLVVVGSKELFDGARISATDSTGANWQRDVITDLPDGQLVALFRQPDGQGSTNLLRVTWPIGEKLSIVGLRGMSDVAVEVAKQQAAAAAALAGKKATAAQNGPDDVDDARTILDPNHTYRIDIGMHWIGDRYETGKPDPADTQSGDTLHQLFFATTPKGSGTLPILVGAPGHTKLLYLVQNVFEPELLERYLAGYEPGQSEQFRFYKDRIATHWKQSHVVGLAKKYGFEISTAVRRIDRPGAQYANPLLLLPTWAFGDNAGFMSAVDRARLAAASLSVCEQRTPGATGSVTPTLEPEAWYEVYASVSAVDVSKGRLRGVTFKTSRWGDPAEMLVALGFSVGGVAASDKVTVGDLAVPTSTIGGDAIVLDNDQAFQNALGDLGLAGWPVATAPRQSRLWTSDGAGGWLFAGFMLESPEPVHRPGRLDYGQNSLGTAGGHRFNRFRRDRSGSRLLYLTSTPFAGGQWMGLTASPGPIASVWVPDVPAFFEDS
jgi:hypothetical protein